MSERPPPQPSARDQRRLAAIVAVDVAGYSRLMGRDESGTLAALKAHRRELIDPKIAEYGGRIVKTTGDGLLLEFPSVVDAVRCAVDVQRGMAERNLAVPEDARIAFRIGINVGDIIIDADDIFGDGVNVAARLEGLAEPGGICVSRAVRDQVLDKLSFAFDDLGAKAVKNIARPVEVFRIALQAGKGRPASAVGPRPSPVRKPAALKLLLALGVLALVGIGAWQASRLWLTPPRVVPYSLEDRRMTFAVLPIDPPANDADAARVAAALTDAITAGQEARTKWAKVATRASVAQALPAHPSTKDLGAALNVHFLMRGNLAHAMPGYTLELLVIDAATERVLATKTVAFESVPLAPRKAAELDAMLSALTYEALRAEVERAKDKPLDTLDVRDLAFRAYVEWGSHPEQDPKETYTSAVRLLQRALVLAPDDNLALYLMAQINLCDCVEGWSHNVAEQRAIGADALDKYLRRNPDDVSARVLKGNLYALRGQYEESLVIVESVLAQERESTEALEVKAYDLLKLGRPRDALAAVNRALEVTDAFGYNALAAAAHFELGEYDEAARLAQRAVTQMDGVHLRNPTSGSVALVWAAAEAKRGDAERARTALATFREAVPGVDTVTAMKAWIHPTADLAGYAPLFDALRVAGVPE